MKESAIASHIVLDCSNRGVMLFRNNSGGFYDQTGRFVRYGLGSFTDKDKMKSSDWIGWTPIFITPEMVGRVLPVFTGIETKPPGWKMNPKEERSLHQKNFIDMIVKAGGYAGFATSVQDSRRITGYDSW